MTGKSADDTAATALLPVRAGAVIPQTPKAAVKEPKTPGENLPKSSRSITGSAIAVLMPVNAQAVVEARVAPASAQENAGADESPVRSGESHGAAAGQALPPVLPPATESKAELNSAPEVKGTESAPNGEMAFAARIKPVENQNQESTDAPPHKAGTESVPMPRHSTTQSGEDAATPQVVVSTPGQSVSPSITAQSFQIQPARITTDAEPAQAPHQIAATPLTTEEPAAPKAPATNISLQVGSATGQVVEVRLSERSGELRVAVHTPDSDMAQGLRQGLSDLTTKLNENGYRAETWHPADSSALSFSAAKDADNGQGHSSNGGSEQQSQGGPQQQNPGRQNQNPSNRPRWVQELETNLHGGEQTSGELHGFIR